MATDEERLLVRLEANSSKLIKEMAKASAEVKKRVAEIDGTVVRSNKRVSDGLAAGGAAMARAQKQSGAFGFALQNASYQVGDFAVQVAGGTSASRAFAQQLPQLLGPLGVLGAVAGAVAAIAIPLASNFLFAAEEMKKIDAISLDGVRSRLTELKGLQDQYSEAIANSANVSEESTQRTLVALDQEYQAKLTLFRLEAITLEQRKRQLEQSLADQKAIIQELADEIQLEARSLNIYGEDPNADIAGFARTAAMSEQLALVQEMIAENADLFLEIQRQNAELDLVNLSLSEAQGLIGGATSLADGLAGAFANAAAEAAQISANLAAAAANYDAVLASTGQSSGPDAVRSKLNGGGLFTPRPTGAGLPTVKSTKGTSGSGSGSKKSANPADFLQSRLDAAQAAAEAAKIEASSILLGAEAAASAKAKLELLQEAKRQNIDLDKISAKTGLTYRDSIDQQAEAIGRLTIEAEQYREQAQFMDKAQTDLKDGFLDAIVEGKNFGDVLGNIAKQLARAALEAALFGSGPFARSGGGGGGLLSGLVGNLFGGFRASGGPVQQGRAYVVGEKQPELFVPGTSGTILPSASGAMGGGSAQVMISLSAGLEGQILQKAQGQTIQIVQASAAAQQQAFGQTAQSYNARGVT